MKRSRRKQQFLLPAWKDHFTFSMRERRGVFILLVLLSIQISVLYYLRFIYRPDRPEDWKKLLRIAEELVQQAGNDAFSPLVPTANQPHVAYKQVNLFPFDPNTIDEKGWRTLGLSEKQTKALLHYRERGGVFRVKKDLYHIKVVRPEIISSWMTVVRLPDSVSSPAKKRSDPVMLSVDISTADAAALEKVKGIGPAIAGRIVRYRERLGGFMQLDQLKEVYGLNDTLWQLIRPQIMLPESVSFIRLSINTADPDSLRSHPYIGYRLAAQIVAYRRQHPFTSVEELKRLPLVSDEIYRKLVSYLEVR